MIRNKKLGEACKIRDLNKVKELVEQGADINALIWATEYGNLELVKYLVEQGVYNINALSWAVINGHLEIVKYLVEQGADIHAWNDDSLRWAALYGHLEVVLYLRGVAGKKWKCHNCLVRSSCLDICKDYRNGKINIIRYRVISSIAIIYIWIHHLFINKNKKRRQKK